MMRQICFLLVVSGGLAGCGAGVQGEDRKWGLAETAPPSSPEVKRKVFTWGRGRIVLGMTKPQVLRQIELSWRRPEDEPFSGMHIPGIERIKGAKVESKKWLLSFGPHTGHAPGGGHVRLFFVAGRLERIEVIPTRAA